MTEDMWGSIEVEAPESSKKAVDVPESIMTLAKSIVETQSRDIITVDWSADKLKDFQRYMKGAAEKLGTRFRMMATSNKGRSALRVTVMKPVGGETRTEAPAAPETPAAPVETEAPAAPSPSPRARGSK